MAPDGLSFTYYVRKGITFHNGEDLKADDVKFSLDRYITDPGSLGDLRAAVNRVEIVSDYAVRVHTKGPQPYLPYVSWSISTMLGAAMPKDYVDKNGLAYFKTHPVGSGPFKLVRQIPGDSVEYEALNSHWRQVPAFKQLTIMQIPEEGTRMASLKTGGADMIDAQIEASQQLEKAGYKALQVSFNYPMIHLYGAYDSAGARMPVGNIKVRQALSLAINRDEIIKNFFFGRATPPPPPTVSAVSEGIDFAYWMKYVANTYRYDLEGAKQFLKEAGYPDGFTIKFWAMPMTGAPYQPELAQVVAGYWLKIGVKTEIIPIDNDTFYSISDTYKTPTLIGQAGTQRYPGGRPVTPRELRNLFHSTYNYRYHLLGKAYPELDGLVDGALTETDPVKRSQMTTKALQIATDSYTAINIAGVPAMAVIGPRVDFDSTPTWRFALGQAVDIAKHKK